MGRNRLDLDLTSEEELAAQRIAREVRGSMGGPKRNGHGGAKRRRSAPKKGVAVTEDPDADGAPAEPEDAGTRRGRGGAKAADADADVDLQFTGNIVDRRSVELSNPNVDARARAVIRIESTVPLLMCSSSGKGLGGTANDDVQSEKVVDPEQHFLRALQCIGPSPKTWKPEDLKRARYGMKAVAFKAAIAQWAEVMKRGASRYVRLGLFIRPTPGSIDLVEIIPGSVPELDERPGRNLRSGGMVTRFRPIFATWSATLECSYNARLMSLKQLVSWCMGAGDSCGVGELRPGKTPLGTFGLWRVVRVSGEQITFSDNGGRK